MVFLFSLNFATFLGQAEGITGKVIFDLNGNVNICVQILMNDNIPVLLPFFIVFVK